MPSPKSSHRDKDIVAMGEDIGLLGGAFGVTDGLQEKFGKDRVYDMPISEAAIVGVACQACVSTAKKPLSRCSSSISSPAVLTRSST
ncbi:MAG: hypothetical protein R2688_02285 [Fimbriimonadaceae bacterium]